MYFSAVHKLLLFIKLAVVNNRERNDASRFPGHRGTDKQSIISWKWREKENYSSTIRFWSEWAMFRLPWKYIEKKDDVKRKRKLHYLSIITWNSLHLSNLWFFSSRLWSISLKWVVQCLIAILWQNTLFSKASTCDIIIKTIISCLYFATMLKVARVLNVRTAVQIYAIFRGNKF